MGYLRPKKHPWRRRLLALVIGLPLAYAAGGFFALPLVVEWRLKSALAERLQREVAIGAVRTNPFTFTLSVTGLRVAEREGGGEFLGWDRLHTRVEPRSLWGAEWSLPEVTIDGPRAQVSADAEGTLNFSDLLRSGSDDEPAVTAPASTAKPVHVGRLTVAGARIAIRDESRTPAFETTLGPVGIVVSDLRTVSESDSPYTFVAVTEAGERLTWRGSIQAAPFHSRGELTLTDLVVAKYAPYFAEKLGLVVTDGRATVHGNYEIGLGAERRALRLVEGVVELRDLKLAERADGPPVVELPAAAIKGATADLLAGEVDIRSIQADGGGVRLRRDEAGGWRVPGLRSMPAEGPDALKLTVADISGQGLALALEDAATEPAARLAGERVDFSMKSLDLVPGARMGVRLAMGVPPRGAVRAVGEVSLSPWSAVLEVELDAVDLAAVAPWLARRWPAYEVRGALSLGGVVRTEADGEGRGGPNFAGQAWLERVALAARGQSREMVTVADLVLTGIEARLGPGGPMRIAEANFNRPSLKLELTGDGRVRWSNSPKGPASAAGQLARPEPEPVLAPGLVAATPGLEVARLVVREGDVEVVDVATAPGTRLTFDRVAGEVAGLTSAAGRPAQGRLSGRLAGAPVEVSGRIDAMAERLLVDVSATLVGAELKAFAPYFSRVTGYEVESGSVTLRAQARVEAAELEATTDWELQGLRFGAATGNEAAVDGPLRLAAALLRDARGRISLELPVAGTLEDPEFGVARALGRGLEDIVARTAAEPFRHLVPAAGEASAELGRVEFAPAETGLNIGSEQKLAQVARGLAAHPGVNVRIQGGAAPAADAAELRRRELDQVIRAGWREIVAARDPEAELPAEDAAMAPADFHAAVKHVFDRRFPPGTELGTPLPPAPPILGLPPPDEDRHWMVKVYHWVTFKRPRDRVAIRKEQEEIQRQYLAQAQEVVDEGLPLDVMLERLGAAIEIPEERLRELAAARVTVVRDYFLERARLSALRIEVAGETSEPATDGAPRVVLELR